MMLTLLSVKTITADNRDVLKNFIYFPILMDDFHEFSCRSKSN